MKHFSDQECGPECRRSKLTVEAGPAVDLGHRRRHRMRLSPTTPFNDPGEDLRLLESAKAGNLQALDKLVRRHQP